MTTTLSTHNSQVLAVAHKVVPMLSISSEEEAISLAEVYYNWDSKHLHIPLDLVKFIEKGVLSNILEIKTFVNKLNTFKEASLLLSSFKELLDYLNSNTKEEFNQILDEVFSQETSESAFAILNGFKEKYNSAKEKISSTINSTSELVTSVLTREVLTTEVEEVTELSELAPIIETNLETVEPKSSLDKGEKEEFIADAHIEVSTDYDEKEEDLKFLKSSKALTSRDYYTEHRNKIQEIIQVSQFYRKLAESRSVNTVLDEIHDACKTHQTAVGGINHQYTFKKNISIAEALESYLFKLDESLILTIDSHFGNSIHSFSEFIVVSSLLIDCVVYERIVNIIKELPKNLYSNLDDLILMIRITHTLQQRKHTKTTPQISEIQFRDLAKLPEQVFTRVEHFIKAIQIFFDPRFGHYANNGKSFTLKLDKAEWSNRESLVNQTHLRIKPEIPEFFNLPASVLKNLNIVNELYSFFIEYAGQLPNYAIHSIARFHEILTTRNGKDFLQNTEDVKKLAKAIFKIKNTDKKTIIGSILTNLYENTNNTYKDVDSFILSIETYIKASELIDQPVEKLDKPEFSNSTRALLLSPKLITLQENPLEKNKLGLFLEERTIENNESITAIIGILNYVDQKLLATADQAIALIKLLEQSFLENPEVMENVFLDSLVDLGKLEAYNQFATLISGLSKLKVCTDTENDMFGISIFGKQYIDMPSQKLTDIEFAIINILDRSQS